MWTEYANSTNSQIDKGLCNDNQICFDAATLDFGFINFILLEIDNKNEAYWIDKFNTSSTWSIVRVIILILLICAYYVYLI
jgi:hypothetical protein